MLESFHLKCKLKYVEIFPDNLDANLKNNSLTIKKNDEKAKKRFSTTNFP